MFYRIAAMVAILLVIGGGVISYQQQIDPFSDTCATAEEAAAQIKRANSMIAKASEQCIAPTNKVLQQVDATTQIVNRYINF